MNSHRQQPLARFVVLLVGFCALSSGCAAWQKRAPAPPQKVRRMDVPRELNKVSMPEYVIEPPDVLVVQLDKIVPRPPYRIETFDVLGVQVFGTLPDRPISGSFDVLPAGTVSLGPPYGYVKVVGMTVQEAAEAIQEHLKTVLRDPEVYVTLQALSPRPGILPPERIVGPDGTLSLGRYGSVYVTGMTLEQARHAIEVHLSQFLESPRVSLDVAAFNSKVYYIITQGAGNGDGVARFPITGNETVLDAVSNINGLQPFSSKRIWIARPRPAPQQQDQILKVDWKGITQHGDTATNYQLMPGDRLFVAEDKLVALDSFVTKVVSPFERIFGFIGLGTGTISDIRFFKAQGTRGFTVVEP